MTHKKKFAAIILAAGKGTRMKSEHPKVMHKIAGYPMLWHQLRAFEQAGAEKIVVVHGPNPEDQPVIDLSHPYITAMQKDRLGTGHAVKKGLEELGEYNGDIVLVYGDMALLRAETICDAIDARHASNASLIVTGMRLTDPARYGRLITEHGRLLKKIVEYKDASKEERAVNLVNAGAYVACGKHLKSWVNQIDNKNAANEYYLTDIVEIAQKDGLSCAISEAPIEELQAANSRQELAHLENVIQNRLRKQAMSNGATLVDPETAYFSADTKIGKDVIIEPNVFFGPEVTVGDNVYIGGFSRLEGVTVADGENVGPFADLRPEAVSTKSTVVKFS